MAGEKIKIFIIGDELGQGDALAKAFVKEGYKARFFPHPEEAYNEISQDSKIDFLFVDCMLQGGTNGVDFTLRLKQNLNLGSAKIVLMSGIFTDKDFVKDALERTKALEFLEKKSGFDSAPYLRLVKKNAPSSAASSEGPPARKQLYQMFAKEKVSSREKRKLIESLEDVSGFDLPFIYSLLVETKSSGYLNIYEKNGSVSGISISKGNIVGVDVEDKTTYLGEMLIQSGYATPEHVQAALAERTNQKIGQRLIRANQLSPHAFDLILTEQMNIRLSRTIVDQPLRINFAATDVDPSKPCIDADQLQFYLHDWIASKLTVSWLKSLYMMWAGHHLQLSPTFKDDHPALEMSLVMSLSGFLELLKSGCTMNRLLEDKRYNEAAVYKAIHFLLTKGLIVFGSRAVFKNDSEQQAALRKIWTDIQGKNPFEIVDFLGVEAFEGEAISELLGPQPADPHGPTGTLWTNLRTKLEEARRKTADVSSREQHQKNNQNREVENKLKSAQKIEEVKQALGLNQFAKALQVLQDIAKLNAQAEQIHILQAWAKLGSMDPTKKMLTLKEVEFDLMQVPAEERYDAHYPFVIGLFHKGKGDLLGAKKNFEKAIALNGSLIVARRELGAVEAQLKKEKDIFSSMDLKGMVSGFFKRGK